MKYNFLRNFYHEVVAQVVSSHSFKVQSPKMPEWVKPKIFFKKKTLKELSYISIKGKTYYSY